MRSSLIFASLLIIMGCGESNPSGTGGGGAGGGSGGSGGCGWVMCPCGQVYCGTCDGCGKTCDPSDGCPDKYYCDYPDGACGQILKGTCTLIPIECADTSFPRACGCDGVVKTEDCVLFSGQDVSSDPNLCSTGTFACGTLMCKDYVEYCEETAPGIPGGMSTFACKQPIGCDNGVADCLCIEGVSQAVCEDMSGQIKLIIAAP